VKERSLVAFTLLSQMAVGAFWVLGALHLWVARQSGLATADTWTRIALWVVVPAMFAAMLASFFHLGTPLYAWRALANLSSSWLSREILFALLFAAAAAVFAVLHWFNLGPPGARIALGWAATLLGLSLICSMANAYRLRTIPAWDTWLTLVSFLTASLLLGALAVGAALAVSADVPFELLRSPLQWIALGTIVLLTVEFVVAAFWFARLVAGQGAATRRCRPSLVGASDAARPPCAPDLRTGACLGGTGPVVVLRSAGAARCLKGLPGYQRAPARCLRRRGRSAKSKGEHPHEDRCGICGEPA
jgi:anaerobic dimethyl sulfoxide reductase subunit C (anchor subunit)